MGTAKPIIAIIYDFDKTLTTTDMQNYNFIPALGMTPEEFWGETGKFSDKTGVERILSYMYMMIVKAREKGINLTKEFLYEQGKNMEYFDGVLTWFDRINEYGEKKSIKIEHYLISSGTKEIIEGSEIANLTEIGSNYQGFAEVYIAQEPNPITPEEFANWRQTYQK